MPAKIRLQRHGKKKAAFFHIVVADSRAPRDGKYIEKLGTYNPVSNPATIDINFDSAINWLNKGAQPTDTARAILSYKGVLYKKHLLGGVKKGALTQEQADKKFDEWLKNKTDKIDAKVAKLAEASNQSAAEKLAAEKAANEKRAAEISAKLAAASQPEEVVAEPTAETEAPVTEDAPAAEAVETAPASEEVKKEDEPKAEAAPETNEGEEAKSAE
jgi:small subunit ribosomal protein S16